MFDSNRVVRLKIRSIGCGWHAIGSIENIIVIDVVHTYREEASDEVIRIISARRATRHERKLYAQVTG